MQSSTEYSSCAVGGEWGPPQTGLPRGDHPPAVTSEICEQYSRQHRSSQAAPTSEMVAKLDRVDPEIIGRVKTVLLMRDAPLCCRRGIGYIVCSQVEAAECDVRDGRLRVVKNAGDQPPKGSVVPGLADPEQFLRNVSRRGAPSQTARLNPVMSAAAEELRKCGMFRNVTASELKMLHEQLRARWRQKTEYLPALRQWALVGPQKDHDDDDLQEEKLANGPPPIRCNLFMVEKAGKGVYRIICDARAANALVNEPTTFPLFTLDALLQEVSNVMQRAKKTGEKWYAVNVDLRHWFHQLPCPAWLSALFTVRLQSGQRLATNSCPMGFSLSPNIGQSCTLAFLYGQDEGGKHMPAHLAAFNASDKHMPAWVPLGRDDQGRSRGAMFVILDNVFLITNEKELAEAWSKRIRERAARYDIKLKGDEEGKATAVIELGPNSGTTTEFMGIEFGYDRWRTASKHDRAALPEQWSGPRCTHRYLAALLGECMWDMRVRGIRFASRTEFMDLYRLCTPANPRGWDEAVSLDGSQYAVLRAAVEQARRHIEREPLPEWSCSESEVQYWACDAAGSQEDGALTYVSAVALTEMTRAPAGKTPEPAAWSVDIERDQDIAIRELAGIVLCVEKGICLHPQARLIMIACDSQVAIGWVERRYSSNPAAQRLLDKLDKLLADRYRIGLCFVPSASNFADMPSRSGEAQVDASGRWTPDAATKSSPEYRQRLLDTVSLLQSHTKTVLNVTRLLGTATQAGKEARRLRNEDEGKDD